MCCPAEAVLWQGECCDSGWDRIFASELVRLVALL